MASLALTEASAADDSPPSAKLDAAGQEATDDALTAAIEEEVVQHGTTAQWDSETNTKIIQPDFVKRKYLKVTLRADAITISSIEINRGNCGVLNELSEPVALNFGESTSLQVLCDPIEAKVTTDRGLYTFTW